MSYSSIVLDPNPRGNYYVAGDTISGKVTLKVQSEKTLTKAKIELFIESKLSANFTDMTVSPTMFIERFSTKIVSSPMQLSVGSKQTFDFSIRIPLIKKLVYAVPELKMGSNWTAFLSCNLNFIAKFEGITNGDIESTEPIFLCPLTAPDLFPNWGLKCFTDYQELKKSCDCFSQKNESIIKFEGSPAACYFQGEMSFPLRLKINPPPGIVPTTVSIILKGEKSSKAGDRFLPDDFLFDWREQLKLNSVESMEIEGEGKGWFCFEVEAKIDFQTKELFTSAIRHFMNNYFWFIQVNYSNGSRGSSHFPIIGCAFPDSQQMSEDQKKLLGMFLAGKSSKGIKEAFGE